MTISVPVCAGYSRAIRAPDKLGIAQVPYGLHRWLPVQTVGNLRLGRLLRARFGGPLDRRRRTRGLLCGAGGSFASLMNCGMHVFELPALGLVDESRYEEERQHGEPGVQPVCQRQGDVLQAREGHRNDPVGHPLATGRKRQRGGAHPVREHFAEEHPDD